MKKQIVKIGLMALAITFISVDASAQKKKKKNKKNKMENTVTKLELKSEVDSVSYAIGMNMIESLKRDFSEANFEIKYVGIWEESAKGSPYSVNNESMDFKSFGLSIIS